MKVGPYEVLGEVGRGGMGVVLRARAPDGQLVALKCLLRADKEQALARFDRERRLLASLGDEEGFVPLLDSGDSPRGPYIVMPFLGGGTLRTRILEGALPVGEAVALVTRLAAALGRAHALGIVHRDLKPENVLFSDDGRPLVADLGLAKHWNTDSPGASQSIALSVAGEARGTAGYMAPEQLDDAKSAGPAADVFALGTILYECLTGLPAFEGQNVAELFAHIASGMFVPVRERRPDAPRWLSRIVERAIAAAPADRFPDGAALAEALRKKDAGTRSRRPLVASALALAILAGGAAWLRPGSAPRGDAPPPPGDVAHAAPAASKAKHLATWGSVDWKHQGEVTGVAFSPDGKLGLSCSADRTIVIRDLATGRALRTFVGHEGAVKAAAFTPDGKLVVSGSTDGTIRVWDVASAKPLVTIDDRPNEIYAIAVSPDGSRIVSGGKDTRVKSWVLATGKAHLVLERAQAPVSGLAFLETSNDVAACSLDTCTRTWDLSWGVEEAEFWSKEAPACVACVDNHHFLTGGLDQKITLWWTRAASDPVRVFGNHRGAVKALAVSPAGKRAVSASQDGLLRCFDIATGAELGRLDGHDGAVLACAFSPDGKRVLSGGEDRTVRLWDLKEEKCLSVIEGQRDAIVGIAISADQKRVALASRDGSVEVRDANGGEAKRLKTAPPTPATGVALVGQKERVVTSHELVVNIWDVDMAVAGFTYTNFHGGTLVRGVVAVPGAEHILTVADDSRIRLLDAGDPKLLENVVAHEGGARAVSVSRDGKRALTGGADGRLVLWGVGERGVTAIAEVAGVGTTNAVALSSRAHRALAGSEDGTVTVVDLEEKRTVALKGHTGPVVAVAFLAGDRTALSASLDGTIRAWDLAHGRAIDKIDLAPDVPRSLAVFSDGRTFLAGTERALVQRYALDVER